MSVSRSVSKCVLPSVYRVGHVPAALCRSAPGVNIPDLVAYYRFRGNGNDSSGNGWNLTVHSGTLVAGKSVFSFC